MCHISEVLRSYKLFEIYHFKSPPFVQIFSFTPELNTIESKWYLVSQSWITGPKWFWECVFQSHCELQIRQSITILAFTNWSWYILQNLWNQSTLIVGLGLAVQGSLFLISLFSLCNSINEFKVSSWKRDAWIPMDTTPTQNFGTFTRQSPLIFNAYQILGSLLLTSTFLKLFKSSSLRNLD